MAIDGVELANALKAVESGKVEQAKLEQTLGRALLQKLEGECANLSAIYEQLGGKDAVIGHVLVGMNAKFNSLTVNTGADQLRAVVNEPRIVNLARVAICSSVVALRDLPEQAARTFSAFASPEVSKQAFGED